MPTDTPAAPAGLIVSTEVEVPIYRLQLERTGSVLVEAGQCATRQDVTRIVRRYIGEPDREHVVAIYLDGNFTTLAIQTISIGGRCNVSMTAAEIFKTGLLVNATGVMLAHNHPSGLPKPSRADQILTWELEVAGALLGIQVIDHVILGHTDAVSMREAEMMVVPIIGDFDCDALLKDRARQARRDKKAAGKP